MYIHFLTLISFAMKVLILGASGFIGNAAALAFVRAGHIVYGQTRSSKTAQKLAADEIIPVVCDPHSSEGKTVWGKIAAQADVGTSQSAFTT